jgi:predicted transcriptional regulator
MSIKPQYADLIFEGTKTVELRRRCPKVEKGDLVLVYVSGPRMALVGAFEVGGLIEGSPASVCKEWLKATGVTKEVFMKYFDGCARAYGIQIKRAWQYDSATELKVLRKRKGGFQPPQSYRYVRPGEFQRLLA